jgi:hypothetical protein
VRSALADALAALRSTLEDLRRRSPRTVALIAVCALIVAVGPLALTLWRTEYDASSSIAQLVDLPEYTPAQEVGGVKLIMGAIINSPDAQRTVAHEVPWLDSPAEVVTRVELGARWRDGRPEAVITAHASTLDDARQLAGATSRTLREKAELVARSEDAYKSVLAGGGQAFDLPRRVRDDGERPVDAALAAFPGRLPPRPQPVWAAVAGLALAAALILVVLALGPSDRVRRGGAANP